MKKVILFILFLAISLVGYTQNSIDSLAMQNLIHTLQYDKMNQAISAQKELIEKDKQENESKIQSIKDVQNNFMVSIGIILSLIGIGVALLAFFGYEKIKNDALNEVKADLEKIKEIKRNVENQSENFSIYIKQQKEILNNIDLENESSNLEQREKVKEMVNYINETTNEDEKTGEDWNIKGLEAFQRNEYTKAAEYFKKATEKDLNNSQYYFNMGCALGELKDYLEASKNYKKAIDIDSTFVKPYYNLGNVFSYMKNYPEAINYYKKAIEIDSTYISAYNNWDFLLDKLKKENVLLYNDEIINFKRILKQNKEVPELKENKRFQKIYSKNFKVD